MTVEFNFDQLTINNEIVIMQASLSSSKKIKNSRKIVNNLFIHSPQPNSLTGKVPFTNQILQRAYYSDNRQALMNNIKTARIGQKSLKNNPFGTENNDPKINSESKVFQRGVISKSMVVRKKNRKKIQLQKSKLSNGKSKITEQANSRSLSIKSRDKINRSLQMGQFKNTHQNYFTNNNFTHIGTEASRYRNNKNTIFFDNFSSRDFKYDYQRVLQLLSEKSAFIFTQQKQIEHLLKKTKAVKYENQQIRQQLSKQKEKNYQSINKVSQNSLKNDQQLRILQQGLQQMKQKVEIISIEKQQLANKYRASQIEQEILINKVNNSLYQNQILRNLKIKFRQLEFRVRDQTQSAQVYLNEKTGLEQRMKMIQSESQIKIKRLQHQLVKMRQQLQFSENKNIQTLKKIYKLQQQNNYFNKKIQDAKFQAKQKNNSNSREQQIYQRRLYQSEQVIKSQRERIQLYQKAAVKAQQIIVDLKEQIDRKQGVLGHIYPNNQEEMSKKLQEIQKIKQIAQLKGQTTRLCKQLKQSQKTIFDLQKQRDQLKDMLKKLRSEIKNLKAQYQQKKVVPCNQLQKMKDDRIQAQARLIKKIDKLQVMQQPLHQQIKKLKQQIIFLDQENKKNKIKEQNLEIEASNSKKQFWNVQKEMKAQINKLKSVVQSKDKQIKEQLARNQRLQIELNSIQQQQDNSNITTLSQSKQETTNKLSITQSIIKKINNPGNVMTMKQSLTKNQRKPLQPLFDEKQNQDQIYIDVQTYTKRQAQIMDKLKYLDGRFQEQKRKNVQLQAIINEKQKNSNKLEKCIQKMRKQISQLEINTHSIKINAQHQLNYGINNLTMKYTSKDQQIQKLKFQFQKFSNQNCKLQLKYDQTIKQKDFLIQEKTKIQKQLFEIKIHASQLQKSIQKLSSQKKLQVFRSNQLIESKMLQNQVHLQKSQAKIQQMSNIINSQNNKISELMVMLKDKQKYLNQTKTHNQSLFQDFSQEKNKSQKLQIIMNQLICERRNVQSQVNFLHVQTHKYAEQNKKLKQNLQEKQKYCTLYNQSINSLKGKLQQAKQNTIEKQSKSKHQQKLADTEKKTIQQKIKSNQRKLCEEIEFLKRKNSQLEQSKSECKKDIECKNWEIQILKKQNLNIQEIMKQQLNKRKAIIEQLIIEKRGLYQQLKSKSY